MKKLIIILGVALAIAGVAVGTCPDKAAHKNAIMAVINEKIFDSMHPSEGNEGFALLAGTLGSGIVGSVLETRLTVKNHFVFSTGSIKDLKGEEKCLSVGVFGHVFTFSKENIDQALEGIL